MTDRRVAIGPVVVAVDADAHGPFWDLVHAGRWEPATVAAVAARCRPGATFIDVGAWIGPLTLLAAGCGARVVAFEPDPVARAQLLANLGRNPALAPLVEVRPTALGRRSGRAALDAGPHGLGNSLTRVVAAGGAGGEAVVQDAAAVARDPALRRAALLKIDIEGGEHAVLPRLASYLRSVRPPLLLSLHAFDLRAPAERAAEHAGRSGRPARRLEAERRRLPYRLAGARRRLPVLWSLRHYRTIARAEATGSSGELDGWRPLGRIARWVLAVRLADVELLCTEERPSQTGRGGGHRPFSRRSAASPAGPLRR
jgi:FkbM family methyltransferase